MCVRVCVRVCVCVWVGGGGEEVKKLLGSHDRLALHVQTRNTAPRSWLRLPRCFKLLP